MDDLSGQVIKGYELRARIGAGGFGVVYRAFQPSVGRDVAIKIILPEYASDLTFMRRFESEAQLIGRLEHPHIVPLYDYWRDTSGVYLVMRWIKEGSLRDRLDKQAAIEPPATARLLDQIAAALALAHRHNVVHRDLKPGNILLDEDNNAYLGDFGLAKDIKNAKEITQDSVIVGSPAYFSPEQILGQPITPQSDIYSLGIVLYEMLVGKHPYPDAQTPATLIMKHCSVPLPSMRDSLPVLPALLDVVIQRATAKESAARYPDVLSLAAAFRDALTSTQAPVITPAPDDDKTALLDRRTTRIISSAHKARIYTKAQVILEKPRRLIGRDALLARCHQILDDHDRILLRGFGGIGKTALAASLAAERITAGKGAVIWLETGSADAGTLFEALARAFDAHQEIAETQGDERVTKVRELLLEQDAMLVLDNVWNERALFQVMRAVPPEMPLIVTSRYAMALDGVMIDVAALEPEQSVMLLGYHARQEYAGQVGALALCEKLGHHPFAVEIAGKRLKVQRHLTPDALMQRIEEAPHMLEIPGEFAEPGRQGIRDLLDDSVLELDDQTRAVFTALGAMPTTAATLELLALVMKRDEKDVEQTLNDLQWRGLAEIIDSPKHYRIHDLTHSYARAMFKQQNWGYQALVEAVQQFVERHAKDYDPLEFEQNNILGTAQIAHRRDHDKSFVKIINVLAVEGEYFTARGHTPQSLELTRAAVDVANRNEELETAHYLLGKLGNTYRDFLGDLDQAFNAYHAALELAEQLKNPHRQALLLTVLGTVRFLQKADDADEYHQKAEKIAQENEDNFALCMILHNRGYQALNRTEPDYQLGCQLSNQAAQIAEGLGLAQLHFFSLLNRGSGELELGQHEQALATHQEALKLAETESNHQWIANILHSIGEDHDALGHRDEAQTAFTKALELYRQIGATSNANDLVELMREKNYQVN